MTAEKPTRDDLRRRAQVLEQVHDSIITTDLTGRITYWNRGARTIFGYEPDEVLGQSVAMLYFEEDRPMLASRIFEPLLRDGQLEVEHRKKRKSGEECYIGFTLSLLRDEQNKPYGILGISTDVTERKQAERALLESEERYRILLDALPQIVYLTDPEGKVTMISRRWDEYSGASAESCLGMNWLSWIHAEDIPEVLPRLKASIEKLTAFDAEFRVRDRYGNYQWHMSRAVPLREPDGSVRNWVGTLANIDERKRSEEALKASEERFRIALMESRRISDALASSERFSRLLLESDQDCISLVDNAGRMVYLNPAGLRRLKITGAMGTKRPSFVEMWREEDRQMVVQSLASAFAGESATFQSYAAPEHAAAGWWDVLLTPLSQSKDEQKRILAVAREITRQREHEEKQRASVERERLQSILENLDEGIIILVPQGQVLLINRAARRLFGIGADRASLHAENVLAAAETSSKEHPLARAMRGEGFSEDEIRFVNGKSRQAWIGSCGSTPVRSSSGDLLLCVLNIRDITTERKAAEQINQANEILHDLSGKLLRLQDEERNRLARELHDGTVQVLSGAIMNLTVLHDSAALKDLDFERRLARTSLDLTQQSVTELRTLAYLLHPPALDELGLMPALRSWVDGFSERSGIAIDLILPSISARLAPDVERALFRITQEALANVHRHSGSVTASVHLDVCENMAVLQVEDEGKGFNTQAAEGEPLKYGVGLLGMRERARQLGGSLRLRSGPGKTVIHVSLPLAKENV